MRSSSGSQTLPGTPPPARQNFAPMRAQAESGHEARQSVGTRREGRVQGAVHVTVRVASYHLAFVGLGCSTLLPGHDIEVRLVRPPGRNVKLFLAAAVPLRRDGVEFDLDPGLRIAVRGAERGIEAGVPTLPCGPDADQMLANDRTRSLV